MTEGDDLGNEYQVEKDFPAKFDSYVDGTLVSWKIEKGSVIAQGGYVTELRKEQRALANDV